MRISDWSSDVCSSDLSPTGAVEPCCRDAASAIRSPASSWQPKIKSRRARRPDLRGSGLHPRHALRTAAGGRARVQGVAPTCASRLPVDLAAHHGLHAPAGPHLAGIVDEQFDDRVVRSEEHTSELQSLMRNSYAVFCLKQKTKSH